MIEITANPAITAMKSKKTFSIFFKQRKKKITSERIYRLYKLMKLIMVNPVEYKSVRRQVIQKAYGYDLMNITRALTSDLNLLSEFNLLNMLPYSKKILSKR
jgi:hypothetical protein